MNEEKNHTELKQWLKALIIPLVVASLLFLFLPQANATVVMESTDVDGYHSIDNGSEHFYWDGTTQPDTGKIKKVTLLLDRDNDSDGGTFTVQLVALTPSTTYFPANETYSTSELQDEVGTEFEFTFPIEDTVDFETDTFTQLFVTKTDGTSIRSAYGSGDTTHEVFFGAGTVRGWYKINDFNDPQLVFLSPSDDRRGTDFQNFAFTSNPADIDSGTYRIKIGYGLDNTDDFTDYSEFTYFFSGLIYDWIPVEKTNALTADDGYKARACLEDETETEIFCTDVITFDILGGTTTEYFTGTGVIGGGVGIDPQTLCGTTNFAIPEFDLALGYTFPRIDFGQGVCKTVAFLFVPKQETMENFSSIKTQLETKAPFSYFVQAKEIVDDVTGTTGTFPTLALATNLGQGDIDFDMLSPTTIPQYVGSTTVTLLRFLMVVSLYLGFLGLVIYETRKLFHKQQ